MKLSLTIGLAAAALALPLLSASFTQDNKISVGSAPEYSFQEAPTNAMGTKALKDMRGKPVLVEFWGTK